MNVPPSSRIAFQGERGAFSEEAAVKLLGEDIQLVPRPTFEALYSSFQDGVADYILAPIENSLAGSVHRSYDLLVASGLHIQAEVVIPIAAQPDRRSGRDVRGITQVSSHPVALAQCERFFANHPDIKRVATDDTAGSVREVMRGGRRNESRDCQPTRGDGLWRRDSARASRGSSGELHAIPAARPLPRRSRRMRTSSRSSCISRTSPGSLCRALNAFAQRNMNLLKIESRPIPGTPWSYCFYLDLQASLKDRTRARRSKS